ncbi:hypothetical protein BS50DRAFT_570453 [Corynespora cassiicola Philippines]|uniref:Uncharacterized protein n=1 Tax=Corynespora cassiicola Philippines TaxID=1448308 RepID=A0A2T2P0K3_CORCC|nr:hypothetical protein BS50DRAFT_570453 [Corynespora cassiicola Philippines]
MGMGASSARGSVREAVRRSAAPTRSSRMQSPFTFDAVGVPLSPQPPSPASRHA